MGTLARHDRDSMSSAGAVTDSVKQQSCSIITPRCVYVGERGRRVRESERERESYNKPRFQEPARFLAEGTGLGEAIGEGEQEGKPRRRSCG